MQAFADEDFFPQQFPLADDFALDLALDVLAALEEVDSALASIFEEALLLAFFFLPNIVFPPLNSRHIKPCINIVSKNVKIYSHFMNNFIKFIFNIFTFSLKNIKKQQEIRGSKPLAFLS